jgi:hypothetical protein
MPEDQLKGWRNFDASLTTPLDGVKVWWMMLSIVLRDSYAACDLRYRNHSHAPAR